MYSHKLEAICEDMKNSPGSVTVGLTLSELRGINEEIENYKDDIYSLNNKIMEVKEAIRTLTNL